MKFHFFDHNDQYLFPRTDAQRFLTYERDFAFEGVFPPRNDLPIANGMRVLWQDDDDAWQAYEIDNVDKEAFASDVLISGVHMAVAELRDVIIDKISFDKQSILSVMDTLLAGTGWARGTIMGDTGESETVDKYQVTGGSVYLRTGPGSSYKAVATYHRGDLMTLITTSGGWSKIETPDGRIGWMASRYLEYVGTGQGAATAKLVTLEEQTWQTAWDLLEQAAINAELLIMPRVEIAADGTITRAIDMHTTEPEYRGIRISCRTDVQDARIMYDSAQQYTALIGIGKDNLTFEDVVWTVAGGKPVDKPRGQNYVELPAIEAAEIERGGRKRVGVVFFDTITDANELIQKTWDKLQKLKDPQITLNSTIADLFRMGYGGQSMRIYDSVQTIMEPINVRIMARIIDLEKDWILTERTRPTIGTALGADILDDIRGTSTVR